ncbi:hypothetical protein T484DRAFT_1973922 [Baffinella frigidus]|nr:hypothetical protein T484DRAFT_1973922 [Cryptophyta sp. CCMP2293]
MSVMDGMDDMWGEDVQGRGVGQEEQPSLPPPPRRELPSPHRLSARAPPPPQPHNPAHHAVDPSSRPVSVGVRPPAKVAATSTLRAGVKVAEASTFRAGAVKVAETSTFRAGPAKVAEASTLQAAPVKVAEASTFRGGSRAGKSYSPLLEKVAAQARARLGSPLDSSDDDSPAKRGVTPRGKLQGHVTARGGHVVVPEDSSDSGPERMSAPRISALSEFRSHNPGAAARRGVAPSSAPSPLGPSSASTVSPSPAFQRVSPAPRFSPPRQPTRADPATAGARDLAAGVTERPALRTAPRMAANVRTAPLGRGGVEEPRKKRRSKFGKRILSGFASASSDSDPG